MYVSVFVTLHRDLKSIILLNDLFLFHEPMTFSAYIYNIVFLWLWA